MECSCESPACDDDDDGLVDARSHALTPICVCVFLMNSKTRM